MTLERQEVAVATSRSFRVVLTGIQVIFSQNGEIWNVL